MTRSTRRSLGALVSAALVVTALLLTRALNLKQRESAKERAQAVASQTLQTAAQELDRRRETVEGRVTSAVSLGPVRALVGQQVNLNTFRDSFVTEEWWRSFREDFTIQQVYLGDRALDFSAGGPGSFSAQELVLSARKHSPASAVLTADGRLYLAGASTVDVPASGLGGQAVMVLARPLDATMLDQIAGRSHGAILVSNGHAAWLQAGESAERARLSEEVGQESSAVRTHGAWAAAAREIAPGIWLWAYTDTLELAEQASSAMSMPLIALWGGTLALMVLAIAVGFRRGRTDAEEELAEKSEELDRTRAALERLSRQYVIPKEVRELGPMEPGGPGAPAAPTAAPAPNAPSRYQLLEQLGEGGMARVYLAVSHGAEGFRRFFVVKKLRDELARQPDAVMQFVDEARLGASLVHSNIVPVYDFGKMNDEYFMAQEYILGRDLDVVGRRLKERERKRLDPSLVFYVAQETLKGLGYAHSRAGQEGEPLGIVHRDVSPMNIMISARGEVKLFDFGIMKAEGRKSQTQHGVVKGNVLFMSPEQARGAYQIDGRADLFSLGLSIFWCLTGETLYRGETTYDLLMRAAKGPGPEEWERIQQLPGPASQVLQRVLQPAPGDRFQSADEFSAALPPVGMAGAVASLRNHMSRLFGDEFQKEERRLESGAPRLETAPQTDDVTTDPPNRRASPSQ